MKILESILDFPQSELCRVVWDKRPDGTYTLTDNARKHIMLIVKWACTKYHLSGLNVRINGSICSNCYSADSDIDIHLSKDGMPFEQAEYYFNKIREDFRDEFTVKYPQLSEINGYRFEVCFQINSVKDLMSVGCYDVLNDKWLIGPNIKDLNFDPYEEYYLDDIQFITNSLISVRRNVMELREKALVFVSTRSKQLRQTLSHELVDLMKTSELLFNHLREIRKTISDRVDSPESANEIVNSKEWRVADSAHKLITKFGYFEILRNARHFLSGYEAGEMTMLEVANNILKTTSEHFEYNNLEQQIVNESLVNIDESMKTFTKNIFLAMVFSVANLVSFESLAEDIKNLKIDNVQQIEQEIDKLLKDNTEKFESREGKTLNAYNSVNCVAITLFIESNNQYKKHGKISIDSVASTIYNRAETNNLNIVKAICEPKQYSEWNPKNYSGGWDDDSYNKRFPSNMNNRVVRQIWREDCKVALQLLRGEFKSVIGDRDTIANMAIDGFNSFYTWGINSDICIGDHWFGKRNTKPKDNPDVSDLPDDPNIYILKRSHYIVKKGDTAAKIANSNGITLTWLKMFNPNIIDISKIKIGQSLTIVKMVQKTTNKDVTTDYLKIHAKDIAKADSSLVEYKNYLVKNQKKNNNKISNKPVIAKNNVNVKAPSIALKKNAVQPKPVKTHIQSKPKKTYDTNKLRYSVSQFKSKK